MTRLLIAGDYVSTPAGGRILSRGVAVRGVEPWDDGKHLGTVCRPLTYVIEPGGDSLRIWYTPTEATT